MNPHKIAIIQPAIPEYRSQLFKLLSAKYRIKFYSCQKDFFNIKTVYKEKNVYLSDGFINFKYFYWHKKLPIIKILKNNTLIVVNGNIRVLNYLLLIVIGRVLNKNVIVWTHGMSAGSHGLSFKIRRLIMNLPKSLLLYTDFEKKLYKRDHIFALNNGLCSSNINLAKLESKNIAQIEVKNNFVNLLYIGRLTYKSNISSLIKAIKLSKTKFNLIVIGSGPEESNLKALSEKIGVKDKITFVGEVYDENKIAAYMLKSKAFIYPGSVGLSLIHAFNYGLPAIVHDDRKNHMPEYAAFTNNYNGIAFKRNSISSLASTIDKFILLPELEKNKLSQNALETIKKSFNVNDMFLRFSQCIESTIK